MFTPTGMGGHRPTGRSRSRRGLSIVIAVVVLAAAVAGGWWWWTNRADETPSGNPTPTATCTTPPPKPPRDIPPPAQVRVNVLNATDTAGLAIDTANELVVQRFDVAGVGNAPKTMADGVAVVLYGPQGYGPAVRVASYVPGATLVKTNRLRDASVDLRLGPKFDGIVSQQQAKRGLDDVALPPPQPRCD